MSKTYGNRLLLLSGIVKLLQPQKVVPKTTIEFLASSKAKKQKCCSGRRIDTNVHLGRDIKKERIQGESKNSRNLLCASHEFMRRFFRLESRLRPTVVLKRMQFPLLPPQLLLSSSPENSAKNCRSSQKSYYTTRQQKCHYFWNMKNFSVSLLTAAPAPRRK